MFFELHILQNFAPSNLNRDDSNAPKDCYFGGFRRARISSQCIKRSIRQHTSFKDAIKEAGGDFGIRTKRIIKKLMDAIKGKDKTELESGIAAENVLKCLGIGITDEQKSEYLLYIGEDEIKQFVEIVTEKNNWEEFKKTKVVDPTNENGKKKSSKDIKKELKKLFHKDLVNQISNVVNKDRKGNRSYAADIALFGRMLADDKNKNVDAACQVAHAISTNEVEMKMDFFTAVDDLLPEEESGSDMMGMVEFNSSCYYRYAQINLDILKRNLGHNQDLTNATIIGLLKAAVQAVPTGMQNSTAAHNQPSYIRAVLRSYGAPWSLANAFINPIKPGRKDGEDLIAKSVMKLENYFENLKNFYGEEAGIISDEIASNNLNLPKRNDLNFSDLINKIKGALPKVEESQ
jgi:CRISPR system Cascade subunit CasC